MNKSIFLQKPKTSIINSRISQELYERLQAVQVKLKALGNEAVFPMDQIVEDALQRAVRLAEVELARKNPTDLSAGERH